LAAILAIGKPVALEASAEERDTRGFISITTRRPSSGLTANWTFEPPVSTPISRSTAIEASRMIWYSLSVSVCAGATVIESPVCTPIGSTFSMEQMMMQLSACRGRPPSRIPSSRAGFLDQHLATGESVEPRSMILELLAVVGDAAAGAAEREGRADDRRQADIVERRAWRAGRSVVAVDLAIFRSTNGGRRRARILQPITSMASRNFLAVLGLVDDVGAAPIISTPYFSRTPISSRSSAQLSAVCPPMVGSRASGAFALDDLGDDLGRDRLDVGGIGQIRIGHDRRRVRVDQDDAVALFAQALQACVPE
jgi:hypothetical protein